MVINNNNTICVLHIHYIYFIFLCSTSSYRKTWWCGGQCLLFDFFSWNMNMDFLNEHPTKPLTTGWYFTCILPVSIRIWMQQVPTDWRGVMLLLRAMCESLVSQLTLRRDCSLYKGFVQSYTTWTSTRPKNFWPTAALISSCLPGKGFVILQLQNVLLPLTHRKHLFWYTSNGTVFDHNQLL